MKQFINTLFFILLYQTVFSQIYTDKENVELAKKIKAKNPTDDFASLSFEETYSFIYNKYNQGTSKIGASVLTKFEIIALKSNISFLNTEFYNSQSAISYVKAFDKNDKEEYINLRVSDYESNGIFHSDQKVCYFNYYFDGSGLRKKFETKKTYFDIKYLTSAYFHEAFPIKEKTIVFYIPKWLNVELIEKNFEGYTITKEITEDTKLKATKIKYTLKDLVGKTSQSHSRGPSHILPHIVILAKTYYDPKTQKDEKLLTTTADLYAWYHSLTSEVKNDPEVLKSTVEKLIADKKTDDEKIKAIFYWIQDNIRYIAFEQGIAAFKPEAANLVFKNRYGDCKGMANLAKQMYLLAGYDAHLTWIGTNYLAYDYSLPSLMVDNHMICTIFLNGKKIYIDGTETFAPLGEYAYRIQNRPTMIENGENFILDKVDSNTKEENLIVTTKNVKVDNMSLSGKALFEFNGNARSTMLYRYHYFKADKKLTELENYLTNSDANVHLDNIKMSNVDDRKSKLTFEGDFFVNNAVTESDGNLFINLDDERSFSNFQFDSTRQFDYEFYYKIYDKTNITLEIPKGYKIEYLPENVSKKFDHFSFELIYKQVGNTIQYHKVISVNNAIIMKQEFDSWNECIKAIKKFYKDQIILTNK